MRVISESTHTHDMFNQNVGKCRCGAFLWPRVNLAMERLVPYDSHNPCGESKREWDSREQWRSRMQSERDSGRGGALAADARSRLLFSVMARNDISMIRKNKPTK